jgi:hypothetical protein
MHPPERPEVSRQTDPIQEHRANPSVPTVPQGHRSDGRTPPRNPVAAYAPDDCTFETFVGGAGI